MPAIWIFTLGVGATLALILCVHALRRRSSLATSYATLTFLATMSWFTALAPLSITDELTVHVGSAIFFSGVLMSAFVIYVADGPHAGRVAIFTAIGTSVACCLTVGLLDAAAIATPLPLPGLAAQATSIIACAIDLLLLYASWELLVRHARRLPFALRVFTSLLVVLVADELIYSSAIALGESVSWSLALGNVVARGAVAAFATPAIAVYLRRQESKYGRRFQPRSLLSVFSRDDLERELVTARHDVQRSASALWETEVRYRRVVEDIPTFVFRFDARGHVLYANPALCRYYGVEGDAIIGRHLMDPVDERDRERVWRQAQALTPEDSTTVIELRAQHRELGARAQRWIVHALFSHAGEALAYQAIGEDVTDAVRAEQDRLRLGSVIELSREPTLITDAEARVIYINAAAEDRLGIEAADVVGMMVFDAIVVRAIDGKPHALRAAIEAGRRWTDTVRLRMRDDKVRQLRLVASPIRNVDGELLNYVVQGEDVTREIEVAARHAQSQNLEAIGQLAGGVAHDFNNHLMVVQGNSELLSAAFDAHGDIDDRWYDYLSDLRVGVQRASRLTRQLLSFSRQRSSTPQRVCIGTLVDDAMQLLRRLSSDSIEVKINHGDEAAWAIADGSKLQQVLLNLIVNANHAMPDGGRLIVETGAFEVDDAAVERHPSLAIGNYVAIGVSDTGRGMDSDTVQRMFDPPGPRDGARASVEAETRPGLASSYAAVRGMGGTILAYSELGLGTSLKVFLPAADAPAEAATAAPDDSEPLRASGTILYCEDDDEVRRITRRLLETIGYRVLSCPDASSAIELGNAAPEPIALLLTDVILPDGNGQQVAAALREAREGINVLYMSGYAPDLIVHHGIVDHDGATMLTKPVSRRTLLREVAAAIEDGRSRQATRPNG